MNHSSDEEIKSFFSNNCIDRSALLNNLKFGQRLHFDPVSQNWMVDSSVTNIVDELKYKAISERFRDMEFAVDEHGQPDGLKNRQEMVLTIASDIADSVSELAFEEAKHALEHDDLIDVKAMEMLKESRED